ncbi:MAG TPA: TolC family protein [Terriglobia bacterium]|nr:TolC family protein [Terriglobia bacterium]
MKTELRFASRIFSPLFVLLFSPVPATLSAQTITLHRAVELALQHATGIAVIAADQKRTTASYRELRNSYIPQLNVGAGIGYTDGFPLSLEGSAPSLVNVTAQSALFNLALSDFIRAARDEIKVDSLSGKDQRNQVIQDTVLSYAELAKWQRRLSSLREAQGQEQKMETAVEERVKAGIDSEMDLSKAKLSVARVKLRMAEATGAADVLREHLAKVTGLPATSLDIDPDSIPAFPNVTQDNDLAQKSADSNPSVQAAVEEAHAQYLRVRGEKRSLWPTMDFAAQYANLTTINDYQRFYQAHSFQPNNVTVGAAVRFPFFNLAQHSRIEEAEADAQKANKQAEATRNAVSEQTLKLQRSVVQMQDARDVAELEYEIAQQDVAAAKTRMESSNATLHDLDNAETQADERYITLQDVTFELDRSRIELMRQTGELESWAMGTR